MISFGKEFIEIRYAGYFWNRDDERLYSIKMRGILTPLKRVRPHRRNNFQEGYLVSHNGQPKIVSLDYLHKLPKTTKHKIPVIQERKQYHGKH